MHVLAIRPERHDDRELALRLGPEHVGAEHGPIAHRYVDILVEDHLVSHCYLFDFGRALRQAATFRVVPGIGGRPRAGNG